MPKNALFRAVALLVALTLTAAACGSDSKSTNGTGSSGSTATGAAGSPGETLLENAIGKGGPCDASKPPYPVGIVTVFQSPVVSNIDQVTGLKASVEAFNGRGGIGGHCMKVDACDSKGDPNGEVDCARQLVQDGVVATLNDTTPFNPSGSSAIFEAAGVPRVDISPNAAELSSPATYAIGAGATGSTLVTVPACTHNGNTKLAAVHVDIPSIGKLFDSLAPMLGAYHAEILGKFPVVAGTTDFQQFTLAAESAGATCVLMPLGENEGLQVLQAAGQLGTKLFFSSPLGGFGRDGIAALGDVAGQLIFNAELPPITADQNRWPILKVAIGDLAASGEPTLQEGKIKNAAFRSWVAVYHLVKIVKDFGHFDDISRGAITAAMNAAKNVDTFGLIPPWTPSAGPGTGAFSRVSQPFYYIITWDNQAKKFVVADKEVNVLSEVAGKTGYPQPGG